MDFKWLEKLQRNKKEYGIYLIRRLDDGSSKHERAYNVSLVKREKRPLTEAVREFDACLRNCISKGNRIEYRDRMFVIHTDDAVFYICLEAYRKCADSGGYMEDGEPKTFLLHRMGVEQAIRKSRKEGWRDWKSIREKTSDPELAEQFPNPADRFVACYKAYKKAGEKKYS